VPLERGLLYAQDADEGVYATTAQLALQGYLPYRDFFTPMPPLTIYLFMLVLRLFYHPWGSAVGLMALRYLCVALGLGSVLATFLAASVLAGRRSGLLAAALVAVDGIVVAQDRRAMLEAPTNLFSCLAVLCYLEAMRRSKARPAAVQREPRLLVVAAGLFCGFALLSKGTALVPPVVIALAMVMRRQWREMAWFAGSLLLAYSACAAVFLVKCPAEYMKQMYLFHMLRPWDGTVHPLARLVEIWRYPWSWATVRLALVGVAVMVLMHRKARHIDLWLVVLCWAGLLILLLLGSRTYWATYFSQLAVPLAILAGSMLSEELEDSGRCVLGRWVNVSPASWPVWQLGLLAVVLTLGLPRLALQYRSTKAALEQTKPAYVEVSRFIQRELPSDAPILTFETNYTFLSGHPPAGPREGEFFIDSYGEMLYRNLGLMDQSVWSLLRTWPGQPPVGTRDVFHRAPAQEMVLAAFSEAYYTVLDGRGLKQLTPEAGSYIRAQSQLLYSAHGAEVLARRLD